MKSSLGIQEFPAYVRASPVHFTNGSPRTCRNSVPNIISPDAGRGFSPAYPAVNRYSSSSLSSQASNEVSNITGQSESSDEPSPSTSSLSSNHSASPNVTSSAPSSARGSPQMAEKHKHSRENACLSPRERPVSAIFPNPLDPAQRAAPHQIGDTTLPRSDPNLSAPDKGHRTQVMWTIGVNSPMKNDSLTLLSDSLRGPLSCTANVLPARSRKRPAAQYHAAHQSTVRYGSSVDLQQATCSAHTQSVQPGSHYHTTKPMTFRQHMTTVPPFTPSPTECQSTSLVSSSPVLSGSYSSGISSLSRCSVSEASGTELNAGDHPLYPLAPPSTMPNSVSSSSDEPIRRENKTPPPYSVYERNNPRRPVPLPHSLSIPPQVDPPALPPKPHQLRTGSMKLDGTSDPRVPRPRPLPRKVSQL
ncbi:hypothetical protein KUCAC02_006504 [Chaenocephalus aceratus]|uniref:Uncharacterized protein n=1 Tax=Chaenocephalus aceratus TaxID=36190 RepID=A0ACB9VRW7_CHAAC|nr:hypothetical protein KUCAC02_006504 [Chaenocephalus aceratus]